MPVEILSRLSKHGGFRQDAHRHQPMLPLRDPLQPSRPPAFRILSLVLVQSEQLSQLGLSAAARSSPDKATSLAYGLQPCQQRAIWISASVSEKAALLLSYWSSTLRVPGANGFPIRDLKHETLVMTTMPSLLTDTSLPQAVW